jgi:hypothetical protein
MVACNNMYVDNIWYGFYTLSICIILWGLPMQLKCNYNNDLLKINCMTQHIIRNLVICNNSICNHMWLHAIIYHLLLYFIMFTTSHHLFKFMTILATTVQLLNYTSSILTIFVKFSSKNSLLCSFNCKISSNFVTYSGVFMYLMYIRVLWTY